jgi:CheY-like chemotaxis protein
MKTLEHSGKPARALEITAALAGRRFGLCGFDSGEAQRISRVLSSANSLAMPFDERLLDESARVCDAMVIKLASIGPEGLRAAATSSVPILVTGSSQALLEGAGSAYRWPRDFMNEPWSEAELLVRLFRLFESPLSSRTPAARESRTEPLVLLADDDPEMTALVEATLRNDGIVCRTAEDGLTALRLAREFVPDLIVLDVKMPKMDGFEVLGTVRRDPGLQTLPVILLTGCDDPADVMRGSELQADEYLGKPVSPNILLNRVKRLLSTHARSSRRWARSLPVSARSGERVAKRWILTGNSYAGVRDEK